MKKLLLVGALSLLCCSCAFANRRNRPLMNLCENTLVPESTAGKVLTAPVVLPACLAAGVVDTVLVHPADAFDDSLYDTHAAVWGPTGRGYVTECAVLPLRAALAPPVWALSFVSRSIFDIPPWPPSPARLGRQLQDGDPRRRLLAAQAVTRRSYAGKDAGPATEAMLNACRTYKTDVEFREAVIERIPSPLTDEARSYLAVAATDVNGRITAAAITRLFLDTLSPRTDGKPTEGEAVNLLARVYNDLVRAGNKEAEVYLAVLAGYNCARPGPRALALYIVRSLARRGWPDHAEAASFLLQRELLRHADAARVDAMSYEWRVLRVKPDWPREVAAAVERMRRGEPSNRTALLRQQDQMAKRLNQTPPPQAAELMQLSDWLVDIKTLLDAEELAQKLLGGPKENLRLFMGDPLLLLREKGGEQ